MTVNSIPVVIKGFPIWQFHLNVAAFAPGNKGWTALGTIQFDGQHYFQTFRQFFPLRQFNQAPSSLGAWTTTIPRVYSPQGGPMISPTPPTQQPPPAVDTTVITADSTDTVDKVYLTPP